MNKDLQHHGIKGQKWGVRRYQNKDGSLTKAGLKRYRDYVNSEDRMIKEGTELQTITSKKYEHGKSNRLYTSYTDYDKNLYKDLMGNIMYNKKGYNNTFVVKKDIKVASDQQVVDAFIKIAKNNPAQTAKDMASAYQVSDEFRKAMENGLKDKITKLDSDNYKKSNALAKQFVTDTLMSPAAAVTTNNFYGYLVKKGFDAISDQNDRKNAAQDPLIILNLDKLEFSGSISMTKEDLQRYADYSNSKEFKKSKYNVAQIQR